MTPAITARTQPEHLGQRLFTFVVVADTHVNQTEDTSTSPFLTNRLANSRARWVFRDIARMTPEPEFGVHLGDMVHPLPSLPSFADAVARYRELVALAQIPFHSVPGNHDIGDKNVSWMPADKVCDKYVAIYRKAFGPDYYSFERDGIRFVVVNALLFNSKLADEPRQFQWLTQEITRPGCERIMVFMHYPPYICDTDERSHYDNIDEPARTQLLALLRQPQVEAVFAGHTHNFWYDRIGEAEFYTLPSTAFVRHDFAEFARVAPGDEFGRNDASKFGYFRVDVHEGGHVAYLVRTGGVGDAPMNVTSDARAALLTHPKTSRLTQIGVELRHPWTERMQITATGGVQEFGRKWARNDYPLLALLEMGARLSKVPELDLSDADSARRMRLLAQLGHRFIVTTLGVPKLVRASEQLADAGVIAFEVNTTGESLDLQAAALQNLRAQAGVRIYFAKLRTDSHANFDGQQFSHVVKSGSTVDELDELRAMMLDARNNNTIDGITVRIEPDESFIAAAERIRAFAAQTNCLVLASLKLEGPNLARERADDRQNVLRVAQAALLSKLSDRVVYLFDTFMDVDRGYFPRTAFIDRRFDPRPPARAFATLSALLSAHKDAEFDAQVVEEQRIIVRAGAVRYALFNGTMATVRAPITALDQACRLFDLIADRQTDVATWLVDTQSTAPNTNAGAADLTEVLLVCLT